MAKNRALLTKREIEKVLKEYKDWSSSTKGDKFYRTFKFSTYINALVFIARISVHAEVLKHHPDIEFSYAKVKVILTTHALKGITKLDVALLERIEYLSDKSE